MFSPSCCVEDEFIILNRVWESLWQSLMPRGQFCLWQTILQKCYLFNFTSISPFFYYGIQDSGQWIPRRSPVETKPSFSVVAATSISRPYPEITSCECWLISCLWFQTIREFKSDALVKGACVCPATTDPDVVKEHKGPRDFSLVLEILRLSLDDDLAGWSFCIVEEQVSATPSHTQSNNVIYMVTGPCAQVPNSHDLPQTERE